MHAPSRHAPVRQILLQHFAVQALSLTRKWLLFTDTILAHVHVASRSPHLQPLRNIRSQALVRPIAAGRGRTL